jgi:hypothetical protein
MNKLKFLVPLLAVSLLLSCASGTESILESARFNLDRCTTSNTAACVAAQGDAQKVLNEDADNVEASLIKASALATEGGIDIIFMMARLSQTDEETVDGEEINQTTQKFKFIRKKIGEDVDIAKLRDAVVSLADLTAPAAADVNYKEYHFQLGLLQMLEAFITPSNLAQPTDTDEVTVEDTENITDDDAEYILDDFIAADNNFREGGILTSDDTGWDLVTMTRNNYCAAKNVNPANDGFSTEELRALMRCQLVDNPEDLLGANGDFPGTAIVSCDDFDYTGCDNTNTAL